MRDLKKLEQEVSAWDGVTIHPHRFGGREFRFGAAEIGHIHAGGIVDIPFPRPVHDALLEEGLAEKHQWVPDSGWTTFRIRKDQDFDHALWLMRLSYLRYTLKKTAGRNLLEKESERLHLSSRFRMLLEPFVPNLSKQALQDPVS